MNLVEAFPIEQARCRTLLQQYQAIGPVGWFGATAIEAALREADQAAASGDVAAMIAAYKRMKDCE